MLKELQKKTYINLKRLEILKWREGIKRPAQLSWSLRDGYPRIIVYLNEDENKKGFDNMIIAPFLPPEAATFIELLKRLPKTENNNEFKIECYNTKWVDGKKTKDKYKQAEVKLGKDDKGICYVEVHSDEGDKTARFDLMPNSNWYKFYKNGEEITNSSVMSKLFTTAYANQLDHVFNTLNTYFSIINFAEEPTKKEDASTVLEEDII